ncbi:hypothetical protein CEXT_332841, partial [Caerostris extrusa]
MLRCFPSLTREVRFSTQNISLKRREHREKRDSEKCIKGLALCLEKPLRALLSQKIDLYRPHLPYQFCEKGVT